VNFGVAFRLMVNYRVVRFFLVHAGRDLAAEVAVNAGVIDEESSRRVGGVAALRSGHREIIWYPSRRCHIH
jgi:hypothetical protein